MKFPLSFLSVAFHLELVRAVWSYSQPVKVFLLSGQSNMVGMAKISHLELLVSDTSSGIRNEYRKALWDESKQTFTVRQDVFYKYNNFVGNLTVGPFSTFGPELMFGWTIGDAMQCAPTSPILLIKAAWGGRSLAIDFRPPASGEGPYDPHKFPPAHYGWEYRQMITDIHEALKSIKTLVPNYNETAGYTLSGMVWFQGWNDVINEDYVHEYFFNLKNWIHDVRLDLNAPNLPVIVGELGQAGLYPTGRAAYKHIAIRQAQYNATLLPENWNNSLFVRTAPYVIFNDTKSWGFGFHYGGRADTMFHIGQAFGRGMLQLMGIELKEAKSTWSVDVTSK